MTPDDDRDRYDVIASRIFFALLLAGLVAWLTYPWWGYATPKYEFGRVGICYRGKATSPDVTARLRTTDGGEIVITFPNNDPFYACK